VRECECFRELEILALSNCGRMSSQNGGSKADCLNLPPHSLTLHLCFLSAHSAISVFHPLPAFRDRRLSRPLLALY
jgi:hypothetical protein